MKFQSFSLLVLALILSQNSFAQKWFQNSKLVEPQRAPSSSFGISIGTDGNFAAFGAAQSNINGVLSAGKVHIAKKNCEGWQMYQEIKLSETENYCGFGNFITMENKTLAVTGCDPDNPRGGNAIYIYERGINDLYQKTQKISKPEDVLWDNYGIDIDISGDFMIVGASYNQTNISLTNPLLQAGAAYIYHRDGSGMWSMIQKIIASDRGSGDNFGISVAISGNTIVIGAENEGTNWSGAAYVFEKSISSNTWSEVTKLVSYDFRGIQDRFGGHVKIDGTTIAITAMGDDDYDDYIDSGDGGKALTFMGSVYIFEKSALNKWEGVQKLRASNASLNHLYFGDNLQLYNNQIAVSGPGKIYMFEKVTGSTWKENQIIEEKVKHKGDAFGRFMSLSEDNLFAGAYWNSYDSNEQNFINDSGAIYVFNTYDQSTFTKPSLKTVPTFESCANLGNGFSSNFDLSTIESDLVANPQDYKFYYKDQLGNTLPNPLPKSYSNTVPYSEKITIRVENRHNSTCYDEIEIELKTIPSFEVHTITPLYACDTNSSGFGFFDLSNLKSSLVEDAHLYDFLFFDGNGKDISPLIDESYQNSNKNFEELLVKITDKRTLCSREIKVPLFISTIVAHQIPTLFSCVKNNLGMAQFDTSKIEEQILQGQKNVIVKYYDENNLQLNSLPNPYFIEFGAVKEIKATIEEVSLGCYDEVSILFNSEDCNAAALQLEIPNYFTPNGDGYNDNWSVIDNSAEIKFTVSVFDRFGKLLTVLENTDPWDGTYQGIEMPSSDYWYLIMEQNGKEHRGHFTLKR